MNKRRVLFSFLLMAVPVLIGFVISFFMKVHALYIIGGEYAVMFLFMLPSDVFSRSSLDYNIKSVNPTYKHESPDYVGGTKQQLVNFLLVALMLVGCLFLIFLLGDY
ncbi:hypothetical protein [Enterococcus wangshanyuanii]|uniref:Uncharacterized protein n=1 Tax=Enterococcus wangshanyuanii TaxID=2005703 RepID=A0ABQ1NYF4_9ENTE|nr:hypothetical protein [Enterococcus wangshanyuanii]GGC87300.1 hypothetical protein GCM10011573_16290 [Enterococcus wangshanyuanii]